MASSLKNHMMNAVSLRQVGISSTRCRQIMAQCQKPKYPDTFLWKSWNGVVHEGIFRARSSWCLGNTSKHVPDHLPETNKLSPPFLLFYSSPISAFSLCISRLSPIGDIRNTRYHEFFEEPFSSSFSGRPRLQSPGTA